MLQQYLEVGKITNVHGLMGEVRVQPWADSPEFLCRFKTLYVDKTHWPIQVERARVHKNMVILKFDGVDTMNEVEGWRQKDLLITRDQAIPLEEDEFFITDLIGLNVVTDEGETLGTLTDVMETGANDVYCVKTPEGKELLLPAIRDCILDVDLDKEEMLVHVLPGLLDL